MKYFLGIDIGAIKTSPTIHKTGGIMFWALDHDASSESSLVNVIYQKVNR